MCGVISPLLSLRAGVPWSATGACRYGGAGDTLEGQAAEVGRMDGAGIQNTGAGTQCYLGR